MDEITEPPSKRIEFPLHEMDLALADAIHKMPPPAKWRAINAIRHLNRAWKIRQADPQMAYFRSITAEEEAATCLFLTLKALGYPGAERLLPRHHLHKNALYPFLGAVSRLFSAQKSWIPSAQLRMDPNSSPPRMYIQFQIQGVSGYFEPMPPLGLSIQGGPPGREMKLWDFSNEIGELAKERNVASFLSHLKERANLRNKLLYAGDVGCPDVQGEIEPALQLFQKSTFTILRIYLLIAPYEQQEFVQQCLNAFLKMLGQLPDEDAVDAKVEPSPPN